MVIQHNIPALNSHRNLGINNSATAKNLEKLSSGYRINRAGDDAAGLAISEKMRGQISGLGMAEQNANNGISLIQTAEGGLNETHSILQRMRELAVQSSNGTYQDSDREQIELEYQALKQEIDRIASYTNYNGIKLLDGTIGGVDLKHAGGAAGADMTGADALAALGVADPSQFKITDGNGDEVADTDLTFTYDGAAWTVDGTIAGETVTGLTFDGAQFSDDAGNTYDVAGYDDTTLAASDGSFKVSAGAIDEGSAQANEPLGATMSALTATGTGANTTAKNNSLKLNNQAGESVEDATAEGTLSLAWDGTAWSGTASITYTDANGVTETVDFTVTDGGDGTTATLEGTLAGGATLSYDLTMDAQTEATTIEAGITVATAGDAATLSKPESTASSSDFVPNPADAIRANRMLENMGLSKDATFDVEATLENNEDPELAALWEELNGKDAYIITRESVAEADRNTFGAATQYETVLQVNGTTYTGTANGTSIEFFDDAGNKVATLNGAVEGGPTETGTVSFNIGNKYLADGTTENGYYTSKLIEKEGAKIGSENTAELVFQVGANGSEDQRIGMYVFNMSSNNLGDHEKGMFIDESSVVTRDAANDAVNTIDAAINYVSAQRANLGALQNRLEHTLNNLGVTKENLTAAESSIRDVDMAKEMMEFSKNNILVQASQAMLAQANSLPQGVLSLLR